MKKILSLALFCIAFSCFSWGQQLKIVQQGDTARLNDSTLIVYGDATNPMTTPNIYVINRGIDSISLYCRRDSLSLPMNDTDNYFCWVLCYGSTTTVSLYSELINKDSTSNPSFQGHYNAYGHLGSAFIRYTWFAARNHSDSAWMIVQYIATPASVQSVSGKGINFSAYPNPASNSVNFTYNLTNGVNTANLKIYNLLGECIQTLPLNTAKNKTTIDLQSIPSGVYVCEVEANGYQSSYQKLVVTH